MKTKYIDTLIKLLPTYIYIKIRQLKDVRAHCYCASLVRTLFVMHARATSFSSARTKSKTQQNIELMTSALTLCASIFVGCSVTPTVFSADPDYTKKKIYAWEVLIISHILLTNGRIGT